MLSVIEYFENKNLPGLIMAFDFEKAFDKAEWESLRLIISKFNFGPEIINNIFNCLTGFKNAVMNNGNRSQFFNMTRGYKQGCPLSPYLFILTAELLGIKLRSNKNIKGIQFQNIVKILTQFADDTWTVSHADETSFQTILTEFVNYGLFTGLKS